MAPEIVEEVPYIGYEVDLFALGVILFVLYAGHPPFEVAKKGEKAEKGEKGDKYYNQLNSNFHEEFWASHEESIHKQPGFFSNEFKSLINCMLQHETYHRLNIVDIIGHPWLAGGVPCATKEEITAEFTQRNKIIKDRQT